jgi:hypothetical protein
MNVVADEMMSPTTRLAQQDVMSPLEDLDLDETDVCMMEGEEETAKTTTPGELGLHQQKSHPDKIFFILLFISVETFGSVADKSGNRIAQNHQ